MWELPPRSTTRVQSAKGAMKIGLPFRDTYEEEGLADQATASNRESGSRGVRTSR